MAQKDILSVNEIQSIRDDPFYLSMTERYETHDKTGVLVIFGPISLTESIFFFQYNEKIFRVCIDAAFARKFKEIIELTGIANVIDIR